VGAVQFAGVSLVGSLVRAGTGPWGRERPPGLSGELQSIAIVFIGSMRLMIRKNLKKNGMDMRSASTLVSQKQKASSITQKGKSASGLPK